MSALPEDKRREEMLRELELLPVWRQRAVSLAEPAVPQATVLAQTPSVVSATADAVNPQSEPVLHDAEEIPAQENAPLAGNSLEQAAAGLASAETSPAETSPAEALAVELAVQLVEPEEKTRVASPAAVEAIAAPAEASQPEAGKMSASTDYAGDEHAAELEYYAASPAAWPEYAESVEPDWYSQEELAAATPDRRAQIMGMTWQALQESVSGCQSCQLHSTRTQTVFGVGDPQAQWLFVGEAPGSEEDKRGEPFVGQAGKLLDNMLAAIQLKRGEDVYIANVLKCRPPANRDPQGEEVQQCDPYLKRQVELIKPKLIVALGKFAAQSLLQSQASIASLRGGLHDFHGVPVVVTYHPAYLLRNLPDKARAWEDLCFARDTMRGLQSQQATPS